MCVFGGHAFVTVPIDACANDVLHAIDALAGRNGDLGRELGFAEYCDYRKMNVFDGKYDPEQRIGDARTFVVTGPPLTLARVADGCITKKILTYA